MTTHDASAGTGARQEPYKDARLEGREAAEGKTLDAEMSLGMGYCCGVK